jgi:hypothetical protein
VLAELVDALDLRDYVLVGQDWGGPIGLGAAGRAPERVAGLVLGNTWAWSMAPRPSAHVWALSIGGVPGRYVVERLNAFVEVAMRLGARRRRPTGRVLDHYRRPFPTAASRRPTWVFAREVTGASAFLDGEVAPALAALRDRPALLPWGDQDPVFRPGDRDRLAAALPRAEVHPLRGAATSSRRTRPTSWPPRSGRGGHARQPRADRGADRTDVLLEPVVAAHHGDLATGRGLGHPEASDAPCTTSTGTATASSSSWREAPRGATSGKARHSTAAAPACEAVRQATRAPDERPPASTRAPSSGRAASTASHAASSCLAGAALRRPATR